MENQHPRLGFAPSRSTAVQRWLPLAVAILLWGGLPLWGWFSAGVPGLEKVLTTLAMPLALTWNLLLLLTLWFWRRGEGRVALAFAVPVVLLGLLGNGHFSGFLCWMVEAPRLADPLERERRWDAIVLLGGSTRLLDDVQPELGSDGHRLLFAAQLFHCGATPQIIATGGGRVLGTKEVMAYSAQSRELLESVGVPSAAIVEVGGINTRQEMQELRQWLDDQGEEAPRRVGLITNAAHVPRALRLAERNGLTFEPLPCAHRGGFGTWTPLSLVPSVTGLDRTSIAWYEILARLAGQ